MPPYAFMIEQDLDTSTTVAKIRAMQTLGVPYPEGYDKIANKDLMTQANGIRISLKIDKIQTPANKEIVALIAYLQRLGRDITADKKPVTAATASN